MVEKERIRALNERLAGNGDLVIYWMQQSQRPRYNHALEYAVLRANEHQKPLVVFFGLTDRFPEANERHYRFMLEGLKETGAALSERGIPFVIQHVSPDAGIIALSRKAVLIVTDRGYLRIQKEWRKKVAEAIQCPLLQVESDVIVPVETASPKEDYSAGIFRPKIQSHLLKFLRVPEELPLLRKLDKAPFPTLDINDIDGIISGLSIETTVPAVDWLRGGTSNAEHLLVEFIADRLDRVPEERNDPSKECLSHMSPYLHFGQISPAYIASEVLNSGSPGRDIYLEELIVRRELSMNFACYNQAYDSFESLPSWARNTLKEHERDPRPWLYTEEELENALTHDPYWNAAQNELVHLGKMHGYMRMYWGKKILEWSASPETAFSTAIYLNNKYSIDGRDPNGFTGVAWCFGKHDRAWKERPVFGKVRYMNSAGLRRKFNIDGYVDRIHGRIKKRS